MPCHSVVFSIHNIKIGMSLSYIQINRHTILLDIFKMIENLSQHKFKIHVLSIGMTVPI